MSRRFSLATLCTLLLLSPLARAEAETIQLLSYHDHPPFVTGPGQGLTYDIAEQLNAIAVGEFHFDVTLVPRSRLNLMLKDWIAGKCPNSHCNSSWVVPWVNPKWGFIKGDSDNYLWQPLLEDANLMISNASRPLAYQSPESLRGLTLGGMRGHKYLGIDDLVNAGAITRIDGNHERDNLLKLIHGRIDVTLLPRSTTDYFLTRDQYVSQHANELYVAKLPHQSYTRFAMIPGGRDELQQLLIRVQQAVLAQH
ncbi:hypothetical protein [Motiliproteus sediminis]|uniref:hypothetical protein n=1 Tax=Motiliproteus sediminis TaxID=1468178 RepID=UPI001AEFED00|nr:hypothetical protein [Motiliproteus sediminis]